MVNIGTHSSAVVMNQFIDLNQEPQPNFETNEVVVEVESDDESCITMATSPGSSGLFDSTELLIPLEETEKEYGMIKQRFISGFKNVGNQVSVVAVHKNTFSNRSGMARVQSFKAFAEATGKYRNGEANIKFAWYGASKDMVSEIVSLGFSKIPDKNQLHGFGVNLAPEKSSIYSLESSVCDEDGLRHVVLCHVILGNLEEIRRGSKQILPSSTEFDSGVDNLLNPKKYIIWSTNMNTHILPVFVLTFKASARLEGFLRSPQSVKRRPTSPWMSFPTLIAMLSRYLPRYKITVMQRYHHYFRMNKLDRHSMVRAIRIAAGDKLIAAVIKSFRAKQQIQQQRQMVGGPRQQMVGGPSGSWPNK